MSLQLDSHKGHKRHRLWVMALGLQTNVLICGSMIRTDVWVVKGENLTSMDRVQGDLSRSPDGGEEVTKGVLGHMAF